MKVREKYLLLYIDDQTKQSADVVENGKTKVIESFVYIRDEYDLHLYHFNVKRILNSKHSNTNGRMEEKRGKAWTKFYSSYNARTDIEIILAFHNYARFQELFYVGFMIHAISGLAQYSLELWL